MQPRWGKIDRGSFTSFLGIRRQHIPQSYSPRFWLGRDCSYHLDVLHQLAIFRDAAVAWWCSIAKAVSCLTPKLELSRLEWNLPL